MTPHRPTLQHARTLTIPSVPVRNRRVVAVTALAVAALTLTGAVVRASDAQAAPTAYSIFSGSPTTAADPDTNSTALGVRFHSAVDGWVTAIRYFRSAENTGPHTGTLWSSTGEALATATFAGESSSGWQQAGLSAPVKIGANTDYIASYRAPNGRYAADTDSLSDARPTTTNDLTATQGLYTYGPGIPTTTWRDASYFVDVAFTTRAQGPAASAVPVTSTTTAAAALAAPAPTAASRAHTRTRPPVTPTAPVTPTPPDPPAPPAPPAPAPPVAAGHPSAANTGVPAGVALSPSGSLTVTTPGTVIDARDITGTVNINASNVTLTRSRVNGSSYSVIRVADNVTNVTISDVEVNGRGLSGTGGSGGIIGPATVVRANVSGVENGLVPGSGSVLRDNFIHGLSSPGAPHYDGIQIDGGQSNISIDHNTVDLREWDQTSAVMIDNWFGPVSNVAVSNNKLLGAGYTVYSDGQFSGGSISGVSFTNNRIGNGQWGYSLIRNNTVTWTSNVDDVTGAAAR